MIHLPHIDRSGEMRAEPALPLDASHSRRRASGQPALLTGPLPPERAQGLKSLALQLAFDSLHEPAPAGQRGTPSGADRHLVYMSRDFAVDLRVDSHDPHPVVRGELMSRRGGPLAEIPAFLLEDGRIAGYDRTGSLGEFSLEPAQAGPVRLCLLLDAERCIDLALDLGEPAGA